MIVTRRKQHVQHPFPRVNILDHGTLPQFFLQHPPCHLLLLQELFLLLSTLSQVDKEQQPNKAGDTDGGEKVERGGFIMGGGGVDDNAGDDGTDE